MKTISLVAVGFATVFPITQCLAGTIGLSEQVWYNIPFYDYSPTSTTVDEEQAWAASNTPAYSFTNTNDSFQYSGGATVAQFFGADAAGAALDDNSPLSYFAFDAHGYVNVSTAGTYTFGFPAAFNATDDAARVMVDGSIVAQENFYADGSLGPNSGSVALSAGPHSFDLFYFQTVGGSNLSFAATGPDGNAVQYETSAPAVPEPASLFLLGGGLLSLGLTRKRRV